MAENVRPRLDELEQQRAELKRSLPKHSVPMAMALRLEDLEQEISRLRRELEEQ